MEQTISFELAETDAQVLQALVDKARKAGKGLAEMLAELRQTGRPLTVDVASGGLVLQDLASYERLLEELDTAEALAGIKQGLESMKAGKGRPAKVVMEELRQEFDFPERHP